jgi:hypothetical protein
MVAIEDETLLAVQAGANADPFRPRDRPKRTDNNKEGPSQVLHNHANAKNQLGSRVWQRTHSGLKVHNRVPLNPVE